MINRGNFNLGDEIRNIVQNAVNNRDFNRLNHDIGRLVNGALDEVKQSIKHSRDNNRNSYDENNQRNGWNNSAWRNHGWKTPYYGQGDKAMKPAYKTTKPVPFTVPVGQVSGVLCTVFGAIGSIASAIAITILGVLGTLIEYRGIFQAFALGLIPCLMACMILYLKGRKTGRRLQRFGRYISQLHGRNYCLIRDLSSVTGMSNKYTVKDLQKMISAGMFPEGHIDDKKTCFMLNNESYDQYLQLQENMRMKAAQEQSTSREQNSNQKDNLKQSASMNNNTSGQDITANQRASQNDAGKVNADMKPEIRKALNEGRLYVQKIKNANVAIPGEEISCKLDRLELVTGRIFDYVEIHPDKYSEIKKFTEYFLPTTLKLLDAYKELDYQPVEGTNISNTKKEIEETLGTINMAFERLLDGLFEDTAMDVSTDISVLETMLAQEGLTSDNVSAK
jgi:5-bromo-4-chloroindolyl phosphate hydrolysis protein